MDRNVGRWKLATIDDFQSRSLRNKTAEIGPSREIDDSDGHFCVYLLRGRQFFDSQQLDHGY